jgi:hypothetical protein
MRKEEQRNDALLLMLILIISIVFFGNLLNFVGQSLGAIIYNLELDWNNIDWASEPEVRYFRFLQFFSNAGIFLFPALVSFIIVKNKSNLITGNIFSFKLFDMPKLIHLAWGFILVLLILPLIFNLYDWNKLLCLPESLQWLELSIIKEESIRNEGLLAMLSLEGRADWYINIVLFCVLAAVGEELFFRGLCQDTITYWTNKPYLSIIITAVLFSVMHFQFFGFVPRFVMGLFLGLMMYWSRSIWLVIFVHFSFNFIQLSVYFYLKTFLNDYISGIEGSAVFIAEIIVTLIFIALFWQFKNRLYLNNGSGEKEVEEHI